jgi:hypothetical protein
MKNVGLNVKNLQKPQVFIRMVKGYPHLISFGTIYVFKEQDL